MPAVIERVFSSSLLGSKTLSITVKPACRAGYDHYQKHLLPCVRACVIKEKLQERLGKVSFAYREKREISAKYRPGRPGIRKQNLQRLSEGSWIHRRNTTLRVCVFCFGRRVSRAVPGAWCQTTVPGVRKNGPLTPSPGTKK